MKIISRSKLILVALCLTFLCFKPISSVNVFSIGDSTMCNFDVKQLSEYNGGENYPIRGWMMMMHKFFNKHVIIHNCAVNGKSSKNFRTEGYWKKVIDSVGPGDYVFIQFGPNDMAKDTIRHTEARTTFKQNLKNYITEVRAKGAYPILFTSITKRAFNGNGKLTDTFGEYVKVPRELAQEMNVPLIDLNKKTRDLVEKMGPEKTKKLYLFIKPGLFTKLPGGLQDSVHLKERGATEVARLAARGLKEINSPLAKYLN